MIQRLFCRGNLPDARGPYPIMADVTLLDDRIIVRLIAPDGREFGRQEEQTDSIRDASLIAAAQIIANLPVTSDDSMDHLAHAWRVVQLARDIDKERSERPKP